MQTSIKRYATVLVLAATSVSFVPMAALADRASDRGGKQVVEKSVEKTAVTRQGQSSSAKGQSAKSGKTVKQSAKVVKKSRQTKSVGHRFQQRDVVVIKDWSARGLRRPGHGEVYVANGDSIYLAAAASLIVKALIN